MPMLQQLLEVLPKQTGAIATLEALLGAILGLLFWVFGARYSRTIITLLTVSIGGVAGMMAPRWLGWDVNTMATAIGGAIVLGLTGFGLHRIWVGIGLGWLLAAWALIGAWVGCRNGGHFSWPQGSKTAAEFLTTLWNNLPDDTRRLGPFVAGAAGLAGLITAVLWPRIATVILYSALGVSIVTAMALWAIGSRTIQWPVFLPATTETQSAMLAALAVIGAVVQWQMAAGKQPAADKQQESE
jgi:hypothetical protein